MKTDKVIATITYNTENYLNEVLCRLVNDGYLDSWAYIRHKPDTDGTKFHNHVFMCPSRRIDTDIVRSKFEEPVEDSKPLGSMPIVTSEFYNWYLYALHDIKYLAKKGLTRNFHYSKDDIVRSPGDWFDILLADMPKEKNEIIYNLMYDGYTPADLLRDGIIRLSEYQNAQRAYDDIRSAKFAELYQNKANKEVYIVAGDVTYKVPRAKLVNVGFDYNNSVFDVLEIGTPCDDVVTLIGG